MLTTLTSAQIVNLLITYRYLIIFPVAFFEGPILTVICGWLVAAGILNFFAVYLILIAANLLGDAVYYAIGYWGGPPLIRRWGRWLGLDLDKVEKMKNHFDNHGGKILLTAKIVPNLATAPVLTGAGLAKYDIRLFLRYSFYTEVVKILALLLIGYYLGDAYEKIAVYFDYFGAFFSVLVVGLIIWAIYYLRRIKK